MSIDKKRAKLDLDALASQPPVIVFEGKAYPFNPTLEDVIRFYNDLSQNDSEVQALLEQLEKTKDTKQRAQLLRKITETKRISEVEMIKRFIKGLIPDFPIEKVNGFRQEIALINFINEQMTAVFGTPTEIKEVEEKAGVPFSQQT